MRGEGGLKKFLDSGLDALEVVTDDAKASGVAFDLYRVFGFGGELGDCVFELSVGGGEAHGEPQGEQEEESSDTVCDPLRELASLQMHRIDGWVGGEQDISYTSIVDLGGKAAEEVVVGLALVGGGFLGEELVLFVVFEDRGDVGGEPSS